MVYESRTGKEKKFLRDSRSVNIYQITLFPQPNQYRTILPEALAGSQPRRSLPHIHLELKITTRSSWGIVSSAENSPCTKTQQHSGTPGTNTGLQYFYRISKTLSTTPRLTKLSRCTTRNCQTGPAPHEFLRCQDI